MGVVATNAYEQTDIKVNEDGNLVVNGTDTGIALGGSGKYYVYGSQSFEFPSSTPSLSESAGGYPTVVFETDFTSESEAENAMISMHILLIPNANANMGGLIADGVLNISMNPSSTFEYTHIWARAPYDEHNSNWIDPKNKYRFGWAESTDGINGMFVMGLSKAYPVAIVIPEMITSEHIKFAENSMPFVLDLSDDPYGGWKNGDIMSIWQGFASAHPGYGNQYGSLEPKSFSVQGLYGAVTATQLNAKQDKLTAGDGISITKSGSTTTISATGGALSRYTVGDSTATFPNQYNVYPAAFAKVTDMTKSADGLAVVEFKDYTGVIHVGTISLHYDTTNKLTITWLKFPTEIGDWGVDSVRQTGALYVKNWSKKLNQWAYRFYSNTGDVAEVAALGLRSRVPEATVIPIESDNFTWINQAPFVPSSDSTTTRVVLDDSVINSEFGTSNNKNISLRFAVSNGKGLSLNESTGELSIHMNYQAEFARNIDSFTFGNGTSTTLSGNMTFSAVGNNESYAIATIFAPRLYLSNGVWVEIGKYDLSKIKITTSASGTSHTASVSGLKHADTREIFTIPVTLSTINPNDMANGTVSGSPAAPISGILTLSVGDNDNSIYANFVLHASLYTHASLVSGATYYFYTL